MSGIRRFLQVFFDRHGVIALMFGVVWAPMIGWMTLAIALELKNTNQFVADASMDAGLIAAATTPVSDLSSDIAGDRAKILKVYWDDNGGPRACGNNADITDSNGLVESSSGTLSASIQCYATVAGQTNKFVAASQVTLQGYNVEVAMVIDNTGSMAQAVDSTGKTVNATTSTPTKITAVKQGALSFLSILKSTTTGPGVIKVGITPFTTDVNIVNPGDPAQTGVQIGNSAAVQAGYVNFSPQIYSILDTYSRQNGCTSGTQKLQIPAINATYASQVNSSTLCGSGTYTMPASFPGTGDTNWSGCVVDRDQKGNPTTNTTGIDYSVSNAAPDVSITPSLFPADNINCGDYTVGPLSVVPLVDIYNATNFQLLAERLLCRPDSDFVNQSTTTKNGKTTTIPAYSCNQGTSPPTGWLDICNIGSLSCNSGTGSVMIGGVASNKTGMLASGNTDLTIGLAWGWNMLTPSFPMYPTANQAVGGYGVKQFLVFFTDGTNTRNRFSTSQSTIDTETKAICTNIKAAGITLFTIGTGDADTSILNTCATMGDNYTGVASKDIQSVFEDIAGQISNLRVTQ